MCTCQHVHKHVYDIVIASKNSRQLHIKLTDHVYTTQQGGDTQALTVGRSATAVKVKGQDQQIRAKSMVNFQPTIEK